MTANTVKHLLQAGHSAGLFLLSTLCHLCNSNAVAMTTSMLQLGKLKIREVEYLTQSHTDGTHEAKLKTQVILTPHSV